MHIYVDGSGGAGSGAAKRVATCGFPVLLENAVGLMSLHGYFGTPITTLATDPLFIGAEN